MTSDQALDKFRDSLKAQGREDLTRYLDTNPLYASFEVKLVDASDVAVVSERLARRTSRSSGTS